MMPVDEDVAPLYSDDGNEDDGCLVEEYENPANLSTRGRKYTVLSEADIKQLQEEMIAQLAEALSLSRIDSLLVLSHYNWNVSLVFDGWFADEAQVRKTVGLVGERSDGTTPAADIESKFSRQMVRSYVEGNKERAKWCPAPGCEYAVAFVAGSEGDGFDVGCNCGHSFCWNCIEDAHWPADCGTAAKWLLKNSTAESENANRSDLAKPCPKCKRSMKENLGGIYVTCIAHCGADLCWLCLGPWAEHGVSTDGFYVCNRFEAVDWMEDHSEEEGRRQRAKNSADGRYTRCYERWASNLSSMRRATAELDKLRTEKLAELANKQHSTELGMKFVIEAWEVIVECRRVLAWTYAHGYYLPRCEGDGRRLFEYLQGVAEAGLERLHKCAEVDLPVFYETGSPTGSTSQGFTDFRDRLVGLTSATRTYIDNLVREMVVS